MWRQSLVLGIFLSYYAGVLGCDEEKCKVGLSATAGTCAVTGGVLTAIVGLFTLGVGWVAGAAITSGVCTGVAMANTAICSSCGTEDQPDLADILKVQKEEFEKIENYLEMLTNQTSELAEGINMGHIISLYGNDVRSLLTVQESKKAMIRTQPGVIKNDFRAETFMSAALDPLRGVNPSVNHIFLMLQGGHPLNQDSLWKTSPSFCNVNAKEYFMLLIIEGLVNLSTALYMKGNKLSAKEMENYKINLIAIESIYNRDCGCSRTEVLRIRSDVRALLDFHEPEKTIGLAAFLIYLTSEKDLDWMSTRKLTLLYSAHPFELTEELLEAIPKLRPVEDFELISKVASVKTGEKDMKKELKNYQQRYVCYKKVKSDLMELKSVDARLSSTYSGGDARWCTDNRIQRTKLCHSNTEAAPWLLLDFGEEVYVSKVTLNPRHSDWYYEYTGRTKDVQVRVSNFLPNNQWFTRGHLLGEHVNIVPEGTILNMGSLDQEGYLGRYVIVQMKNTMINLFEVKAFGRKLYNPSGISD